MRTCYCTIIDIRHLFRAWTLYASIKPYLGNKVFVFGCLDDDTHRILSGLDDGQFLALRRCDFLTPELEAVCGQRTGGALAWTCKPLVLDALMQRRTECKWVVYLDADMACFADPDQALAFAEDAPLIVTPHGFATPLFSALARDTGHFNAGYVAFRRETGALRVLDWWKARCLEACPTVPTAGIYGDQKYLEQFAAVLGHAIAPSHPGLNVAPWNLAAYALSARDGRVRVDDVPLLVYHFQGLKVLTSRIYNYYSDRYALPNMAIRHIYAPYARWLHDAIRMLRRLDVPIATYRMSWKEVVAQTGLMALGKSNIRHYSMSF